jgi:hypothetical protein
MIAAITFGSRAQAINSTAMRAYALAGLFCLVHLACSGGDDADAGVAVPDSGGGLDASDTDSGLFSTPCGNVICTSDQYCQIDPTAACTPSMVSTCAATEEVCQKGGDGGCTMPRTRECRALPAPCAATAQCACMINQNLCPNSVLAMCNRPSGEGVTIECPFP